MKYLLVQMALQSPGRFFDRFGPAGVLRSSENACRAFCLERSHSPMSEGVRSDADARPNAFVEMKLA
ncbi:hypothetical protein [Steroidobacter agaridevorans]|uniref:hypothetical protein n=1 Tax=Steroidobacter agaridevorans TaxID=2695856 RepID=UPI00137AEBCD|nr:hypothetical protein [Steroidobacter agaridevorans]